MKTLVILRKRSDSLRDELPTKDLCISDDTVPDPRSGTIF
jgi:hypothetical protein